MKPLYPLIVRLLAYAGFMFLISFAIQFDFAAGQVKEDSYTEVLQEVLLLIASILLIVASFKSKTHKLFFLGLAGFLGVHFVREFDFWLNTQLFDKAWQVISLVIVIAVLVMIIKNWKKIIEEIACISKTYGFAFFFSGLIILHVFSRLYGRKLIWIDLMRENHSQYVIKQDGDYVIELLAYSIMFIGVIEMINFGLRTSTKS